ncbi:ABC transporter substrate-binding protein [Rhodovulum sp. DZ06]|uniref:ABC transporter substrate-binding protein n=1 Tax=Rhodovulum sp. DZ06 TaxID=3425126 RepID=UPI003D325F9B
MSKRRMLAIAAAFAAALAPAAQADLNFYTLNYRTGPYANNGIPSADGFADYMTLLNERDGGIGGEKVHVEACEFGYSTEKGLACYEKNADKGTLAWFPNSTALAYKIIELARESGTPVVTQGYGFAAAANGEYFPHVFNFPANYWHGAAAQVRYIKENTPGGNLNGMKIGLVYHNSPYGKEPINTLKALAAREGFEVLYYPVDHPGKEQRATWDQIKTDKPDWTLLWGWGEMNPVALRQAKRIKYPMERLFGVWWSANETDVKKIGRAADGYKSINFHAVGTEFSAYNDLNEYVYFAGKAAGQANNLGTSLYNRGLLAAATAAEAIRIAQRIHGVSKIDHHMMRDGYEALVVDDAMLTRIGLEGFIPPMKLSCKNHLGAGMVAINEWDSRLRGWKQVTDYYAPETALIDPLIEAYSAGYAQKFGVARRDCK